MNEDKNMLRQSRIQAFQSLYAFDMGNILNMGDEYTHKLVDYFMANQEKVDGLISNNLINYTLARLSYVNRALVRMAVSEMLLGVPAAITINEALEIAKIYSDDGSLKDVKFLNRLLDNIKNNM